MRARLEEESGTAMEAARRESEALRAQLGEMKSRQNFKDLGKLTASLGIEDPTEEADGFDETGGGGSSANANATGGAAEGAAAPAAAS